MESGNYSFSTQYRQRLLALGGDLGPDDSKFVQLTLRAADVPGAKSVKTTVWYVGNGRYHVLPDNGKVSPAILHATQPTLEVISS